LAAAAAFLRSPGFFFELAEELLEVLTGAEVAAFGPLTTTTLTLSSTSSRASASSMS